MKEKKNSRSFREIQKSETVRRVEKAEMFGRADPNGSYTGVPKNKKGQNNWP